MISHLVSLSLSPRQAMAAAAASCSFSLSLTFQLIPGRRDKKDHLDGERWNQKSGGWNEGKQIREFCCKSSSSFLSPSSDEAISHHYSRNSQVRCGSGPRPRLEKPRNETKRNEKRSFKTAHVMFFFLALFYFIFVSRWRSSQPEWGRCGEEGGP